MKFAPNELKFIGILLFILISIFLIELLIPMSWREIPYIRFSSFSLHITLVVVFLICIKHFKKTQFTRVNIPKTLLFSFVLAIIIRILIDLIDNTDIIDKEDGEVLMNNTFHISVLIIAPILEELSIRIGIINAFKDKLPHWLLIIGTSLLFGVLHMKNINFVIATFIMGVILSYLFIQSGNGLLLILTHFFINLFTYIPREYYVPFYIFLLQHIYIPIVVFALLLIVIILKRDKFKKLLLSTVEK